MSRKTILRLTALVPIVGIALWAAATLNAADQPSPPKEAPKKDAGAPRDAAAPKEAPPPKTGDSRDSSPRPPATTEPRPTPPREANQNPPAAPQNPRDARDARNNADRDSRDAARDNRDAPRDDRDRARDPRDAARDQGREANRQPPARDTRREAHRSDRDLGINFGRVTDRGLAISDLAATSGLYRSGLRTGDYIISVNGHRLERSDDFDRWVYEGNGNDRIKVIVWRNGREEVVYLEPTVFYADESYNDDFTYFGVVFDDRYPDRLIVLRVYPDSPAFVAGLREGDEITTWHGERIKSPRDLGRLLHRIDAGKVDFEYSRNSKPLRAEAQFNQRVAAKPATGDAAPARDGREPARDGREPARERPAPPTNPTVTPNPPGTPAPAPPAPPAQTPPPPRRPLGGVLGR